MIDFIFDLQRFDSTFGDGSGTSAEDPYQIATVEHLQQLATDVNNGITYENKYFKVTADIDLSTLGENYSWTATATTTLSAASR